MAEDIVGRSLECMQQFHRLHYHPWYVSGHLYVNAHPYYQLSTNLTFEDFSDIPMDGIEDLNELDEYLSLPIEWVSNPIRWWWEHCTIYPWLSSMAFDFLSAPGM